MRRLFGKKEEPKEEQGCKGCPSHGGQAKNFQLKDAMEAQMKEMEKNKVKSSPCPFIDTCTYKMLPGDFNVLCNDQESGMETQMVHLRGRHLWEMCKEFFEYKRQAEGKLPKGYLAELKKKGK